MAGGPAHASKRSFFSISIIYHNLMPKRAILTALREHMLNLRRSDQLTPSVTSSLADIARYSVTGQYVTAIDTELILIDHPFSHQWDCSWGDARSCIILISDVDGEYCFRVFCTVHSVFLTQYYRHWHREVLFASCQVIDSVIGDDGWFVDNLTY